jgi:hypothetical protein
MQIAVLEVHDEGGLVLADRVSIVDSSSIIITPRLSELLDVLEKSGRRTSIRVKYEGVSYRVECKPAGTYVVGPRASVGERWISELRMIALPNSARRRLNGRFAHMLSAGSLIGAGYVIQSTRTWGARALLETAAPLLVSVSLFVIGHLCFSDDGSKIGLAISWSSSLCLCCTGNGPLGVGGTASVAATQFRIGKSRLTARSASMPNERVF